MALMPKARHLIIRDGDYARGTAQPDIPGFLAAIGAAGIGLTSLDINLLRAQSLKRTELDEDGQMNVQSALRSLKRLKVCSDRGKRTCLRRYELLTLANLMELLLHAEKLETLVLAPRLWGDLDPAFIPPVSVVSSRTRWHGLSKVALLGVMVRYADLKHLLICTDSSQGSLELRATHLLDGSWVPVLDLLRARHRMATVTAPSGAECEAMTPRKYESIFGRYIIFPFDDRDTAADRYIRGTEAVNPLLNLDIDTESSPESNLTTDSHFSVHDELGDLS